MSISEKLFGIGWLYESGGDGASGTNFSDYYNDNVYVPGLYREINRLFKEGFDANLSYDMVRKHVSDRLPDWIVGKLDEANRLDDLLSSERSDVNVDNDEPEGVSVRNLRNSVASNGVISGSIKLPNAPIKGGTTVVSVAVVSDNRDEYVVSNVLCVEGKGGYETAVLGRIALDRISHDGCVFTFIDDTDLDENGNPRTEVIPADPSKQRTILLSHGVINPDELMSGLCEKERVRPLEPFGYGVHVVSTVADMDKAKAANAVVCYDPDVIRKTDLGAIYSYRSELIGVDPIEIVTQLVRQHYPSIGDTTGMSASDRIMHEYTLRATVSGLINGNGLDAMNEVLERSLSNPSLAKVYSLRDLIIDVDSIGDIKRSRFDLARASSLIAEGHVTGKHLTTPSADAEVKVADSVKKSNIKTRGMLPKVGDPRNGNEGPVVGLS